MINFSLGAYFFECIIIGRGDFIHTPFKVSRTLIGYNYPEMS